LSPLGDLLIALLLCCFSLRGAAPGSGPAAGLCIGGSSLIALLVLPLFTA
jgi:hypothetical protein